MRRTLAIICFLIGFSAAPLTILAQVSDAQDEFVNAFLSSRKGEEQEKAGDFKAALAAYRTAASLLTKIKQESPGWQPEMRDFRLAQTLKAIERVQARTGGPANDLGLPPLLPGDPLDPAPGSPVAPPARKPGKVTGPVSENPIEAITQRIANLETQLADANDRLREEQQKNAQLTQEMGEAMDARKKAEGERKKAQDLAEVYQKAMLELKAKGDASSERVKELEGKLADLKRKNLDTEVELASAEERIAQYIIREHHRGRPLAEILNDHYVTNRTTPEQVKRLLDRPELVHDLGDDLVFDARNKL